MASVGQLCQRPYKPLPGYNQLSIGSSYTKGWEGHLAPRSSTFKTWGIIQTNSVGVVDDTYIGDNDQWHMPVYCLDSKNEGGTWIKKGDKIGQFRIMEVMPEIEFEEVEVFNNSDRGGFGSTGER